MPIKIAINGFGRMGRLFFRTIWDHPDFQVVLVNEPNGDVNCSAHLLEFDSIHGKFQSNRISVNNGEIHVGTNAVHFSQQHQLSETTWQNADIVVEASGCYRQTQQFDSIFEQGVKKVLVACPVKDNDTLNIAYGVNHKLYQPDKHHLVTAASCTTNCLAPVIQVLLSNLGIEQGAMTTIHDVTNTQTIIDSAHKDLRRARSCADSLIPTTSGSTTAIMKIFPQLEGKLDGLAVRVPVTNASIVDLVIKSERATTVEEVNGLFKQASETELKGILGFESRPLVSIDYKDDKRSAIIDGLSTQVIDQHLVKVIAWYDNEINYVERMKDIIMMIAKSL